MVTPRTPRGLRERDSDDIPPAQRHHLAEAAGGGEIDGRDAEAGRKHPVERGRRAAALEVAEHRHPCLEPGQLLEPGAMP